MAVRQPDVNQDDLTDADGAILDVLHDGPRTKGAIVDETGLHRNTVGNRLDVLKAGEAIDSIHERTALYEITDDPRPGHEIVTKAELRDRVDELQERVDDTRAELDNIDAAFERGDPSAAREALERAQEAISEGDPNE